MSLNLDVPPPPPDIISDNHDFKDDLEGITGSGGLDFPPFPAQADIKKDQGLTDSKIPQKGKMQFDMPVFEPSGKKEDFHFEAPPVPRAAEELKAAPESQKAVSQGTRVMAIDEQGSKIADEGKKLLRERPKDGKPRFVRIEKFKETLRDISVIKSDLRKAEEMLDNIMKARPDKEKAIETWNSNMQDIQKKLIFIEKMLFEGD